MRAPYDLIKMSEFPTMPANWISMQPGELWLWGDIFFIIQVNPPQLASALQAESGKPAEPSPLKYEFAATAFYCADKNPHGSSRRPIASVTIETMDYSKVNKALSAVLSKLAAANGSELKQSTMTGLFTASMRVNLGEYPGALTIDAARQHFIPILRSQLGLEGEPVRGGVIADAWGNPFTGLPARKARSGCGAAVLSLMLLVAVIAVCRAV